MKFSNWSTCSLICSEISGVSHNIKLRELFISKNKIGEIQGLDSLVNLQNLALGDNLITVDLQMWMGKVTINYSDDESRYNNMTIEEFSQLFAN